MKLYQTFELTYTAPAPVGSWVDVDLTAVFTLNGKTTTVKGFYDGGETYRIRYYPSEVGECSWTVSGIVSDAGSEAVEASDAKGIVRAEGTRFRYDNGDWFYPMGTTIYAMVSQPEELVDTTIETLSKNPFNKVRMCVFPKHYDFNHNEPPLFAFAFKDEKPDVTHPDPAYWQMLERRLAQMSELGIQSDLIIFHPYDKWGFAKMPLEDCMVYLDYLTRRLSAIPNVWWSLANEYDIMRDFQLEWWSQFAAFIGENDPYHHLLSNHNMIRLWDFNEPNTTHCCIQGRFYDETGKLIDKYNKPVLFDEMCYEGNIHHSWGNISGREMARRFWVTCAQGGYATHGETFLNEEECLWWAQGGKLIGESPARIAFLRETLESLPGPLSPGLFGSRGFAAIDPDKITEEQKQHPMAKLFLTMPKEDLARFMSAVNSFGSHYEDQVYLKYLDKECPIHAPFSLPEDGDYTVYAIDTWEMTRTVALEHASGSVNVPLPGKEAMAILAVKE